LFGTFPGRTFGYGLLGDEMRGEAITHSLIDDSKLENFYLPLKPTFPQGGTEFACPSCGHKKKYNALDVFYRE